MDDPAVKPWIARDSSDVESRANAWLLGDALERLVANLGGPLPRRDVAAFVDWSGAVLDTRVGRERHDAPIFQRPADHTHALLAEAQALGLMQTAMPTSRTYDATVVLGGTTTGNRMRVELAHALHSQGIDLGALVLLTAERDLGAIEIAAQPDSQADETEWRNLLRNAQASFGWPLQPDAVLGASRTRNDCSRRGEIILTVAPAATDGRRPNTLEAVAFLGSHWRDDPPARLLVVTSAIYTPYQFFTAVPALLASGVREVQVVGTPTSPDGDRDALAQMLAQEIHAAVLAAHRLETGA